MAAITHKMVLLGIVSFALGLSACNGDSKAADKKGQSSAVSARSGDGPERGQSLQTVGVMKGDVTRVISASGKVIPKRQVMVGSEVSGRVVDVKVDFNSVVSKGDILAQIDAEKFNNSLERLQGRMKSAEADVSVQLASINRARVSFEQNQKVLTRQTNLFQQEAVSKARLEEAERAVGVAEADVKLAEARLESAKATIAQTKAEIRNAQLRFMSKTQNNIVTYVAIVSARNDDGILLPGMTANLEITADVRPNVSRLPISAERFRPTPDQIAQWQDPDSKAEEAGALDGVYERLSRAGVSDSKIEQAKIVLQQSTQPLIDIIDDPTKSFMHTPMKIQLADLTTNILKSQLTPEEFSNYNSLLQAEKNTRLGELWVLSGTDKMKKVPVKFGLSDSAFVELLSGLSEGDKVVTGLGNGGGGRAGGRPGGKP